MLVGGLVESMVESTDISRVEGKVDMTVEKKVACWVPMTVAQLT